MLTYGKKLWGEMKDDRATGLAAEQAYYYTLAIFPLLILTLSILPYLSIDPNKAVEFINSVLPSQIAELLEENIQGLINNPNGGLLTFGIIGTLWSASNGINAFIRAMNEAFDTEETRPFYLVRLLSIGLTIGLIFAFLIAFLLPIFGGVILNTVGEFVNIPGGTEVILNILRFVIAFVVIFLILSALYRIGPDISKSFKDVMPGALFATIIWQLISLGFSFYVSNFGNFSSTYGSLGGFIILMLWLFLTGLALVIGGEINAMKHKIDKDPSQKYHNEKFTSL